MRLTDLKGRQKFIYFSQATEDRTNRFLTPDLSPLSGNRLSSKELFKLERIEARIKSDMDIERRRQAAKLTSGSLILSHCRSGGSRPTPARRLKGAHNDSR